MADVDYAALAEQARQAAAPSGAVDYAALAEQARKGTDTTSSEKPKGLATIGEQIQEKLKGAPAVGETVGGLVGSLAGARAGAQGSRVGAMLGGAAGRGYGELLAHASEIPGAMVDVARNLVQEPAATLKGAAEGMTQGAEDAGLAAARQGALEVAGEGVAAGAGKLGKWLMNRATSRVTARLAQEFPELSDTLIDNALTVSEGGESKARMLLKVAKGKATQALQTAEQSGATIPAQLTPDIAESFKTALVERGIKDGTIPKVTANGPVTTASARIPKAMQSVFQGIDDAVANSTPVDLTPTQADVLKTQLQKESRALYFNRIAPNGSKAMSQSATELADYASRLNDALDSVATGYKAANAEAKPLIGAVRGIHQAIRPSGNLYQAMVRPAVGAVMGEEAGRHEGGAAGAVIGGLAGAAMTSPRGMSQEAILLAHPATQTLLRQLPRGLSLAVKDFLEGRESGTPIGGSQ